MPLRKINRLTRNIYLGLRCILFKVYSAFTFARRKKTFSEITVRKILVVGLTRIGDNVASIPAFRALKEHYKNVELVVLTNDYVKELLENVEWVDRIVIKRDSVPAKIGLVKSLRLDSFDLAVDLTCDYTFMPALWASLSGAKYRVGYDIYGRGFLFNKAIKHNKKHIHVIDETLNIVRAIGLDMPDKQPHISVSYEAKESVRQFLAQKDIGTDDLLVGIHPGGHYPTQRWLEERFAALADRVTSKYKAARLVLMGSRQDKEMIERIERNMKNEPIIFLNQPLKSLLALIQRCQLFIGNNSGLLHMATAVDTPTVSTMGPTTPERWRPYGENHIVVHKDLPCRPCNSGYCRLKTNDCMKLITVDEFFEAVDTQLSRILYKAH